MKNLCKWNTGIINDFLKTEQMCRILAIDGREHPGVRWCYCEDQWLQTMSRLYHSEVQRHKREFAFLPDVHFHAVSRKRQVGTMKCEELQHTWEKRFLMTPRRKGWVRIVAPATRVTSDCPWWKWYLSKSHQSLHNADAWSRKRAYEVCYINDWIVEWIVKWSLFSMCLLPLWKEYLYKWDNWTPL